jgi:hypothetical protein
LRNDLGPGQQCTTRNTPRQITTEYGSPGDEEGERCRHLPYRR